MHRWSYSSFGMWYVELGSARQLALTMFEGSIRMAHDTKESLKHSGYGWRQVVDGEEFIKLKKMAETPEDTAQ